MNEEKTTIRIKCHSDEMPVIARRLAEQMIKVWYLNGSLLIPDEKYHSLTVSYRRLYQSYRDRAKDYTQNVFVEQLLSRIVIDERDRLLKIDHIEDIQGDMAIYDDGHGEFFIQLCFMLSLLRRDESFEASCNCESEIGSQYTRAICCSAFLRFDCYGHPELYERYVWEYREGYGGYAEIPMVSQFAAMLYKVRIMDILAFRDDKRVWSKFDEIQDRLGEEGRILLRLPSAEPFVRVMVEAPTYSLCDSCMQDFLHYLNELGYPTE